jgi:uncharacterized protein YbjQ (UPF0145 family)
MPRTTWEITLTGEKHPSQEGATPKILGTNQMKVTTLETIAGHVVEETIGIVRGSAMWSRRIMKKSTAGHRALEHMTSDDIAEGLLEVREKAEAKMLQNAKAMGANGIIGMKFELVELGSDMFQAIAYGTAVVSEALAAATPAFQAPIFANTFGQVANDFNAVVLPFQPRRVGGMH